MITGKINLAKFEHFLTQVPNKSGQKEECIVIPIGRNNMTRTEKGNVFVDIAVWLIAPEKRRRVKKTTSALNLPTEEMYESTHAITQSFDKEKREAMKAANQSAPILGNLLDWDLQINAGGQGESQANTSADFNAANMDDNLPF